MSGLEKTDWIKGCFGVALSFACAVSSPGQGPASLPAPARAAATQPGGGRAGSPSFAGSADLPGTAVEKLFSGFGLTGADFGEGRIVDDRIGFAIYDRKGARFVASYNLDRTFDLASTTKLFTMSVVGDVFRDDPVLEGHRAELTRILHASLNRGASLWLLLARARSRGRPVSYDAERARWIGNCYGGPLRSDVQRQAELEAAGFFFQAHRRAYAIDWGGAQVVDGAGCERGLWPGREDRMSPRQYLTVLDALRQRSFGGASAFDLMPQMQAGSSVAATAADPHAAPGTMVAWKTGTDAAGIKNIVGYIPRGSDPFGFYFVMFVNTGKPPVGLINGGGVVKGFAAWAARTALRSPGPR